MIHSPALVTGTAHGRPRGENAASPAYDGRGASTKASVPDRITEPDSVPRAEPIRKEDPTKADSEYYNARVGAHYSKCNNKKYILARRFFFTFRSTRTKL